MLRRTPGGATPARHPPADVAGTLSFVGCDPDPADVTVRLALTEAVSVDEETGSVLDEVPLPMDEAPEREPVRATVESTEAAGVLRFRAPELTYGFYRMAVQVDDPACGQPIWRGPEGGLVVAGDESVALDAIALRTRLEVNAGSESDPRWVSADWVDDETTELQFRMSTDLEGVTAFDVQFSYERFEVDRLEPDDFCNAPGDDSSGERIESPPDGRELTLDVSPFFAEPAEGATESERQRYEGLLRGAPVYVRVVPVGSEGPLCNIHEVGASSWVRLVYRPTFEVTPVEPPDTPPYRVVGSYEPGWNPTPEIISEDWRCFRVITPHQLPGPDVYDGLDDPIGKMMVLKGWFPPRATVGEGVRFCFGPPKSDGGGILDDIGDAFGDLVGDIVDAVEWAVNKAAALYEEIKSAAVGLVANAIADLTGCEEICRAALELGMEIALTSMGMPPSLPDFDQLMDQGLDYVAAELAAQVGVPDFVAEEALELAIEMAERAKATRGMAVAKWIVPDTGGRSSLFTLEVSRNLSGASTTSAALWFRPITPEQVWEPRYVATQVPPVGEPPLRVPVVVEPILEGLPETPPLIPAMLPWFPQPYYGSPQRVEAWYQRAWGERLNSHRCARFEFWRAISVRYPVPLEPVAAVNISHDMPYDGFTDPFEEQCSL